jgi:ABC-type dipeptide/oligopeptide/nickel transport system permease component
VFIVRRLAALAATIVIAPAVSFVVFDMLSKDYFAPGETIEDLIRWESGFLFHFDLGYSRYYNGDITWVVEQGFAVDMVMLFGGLAFGLLTGIGGGLLAVARPRSATRRGMDLLAGLGVSMPVYWMGFAVLMLFASNTGLIVMLPFVSGAAAYKSLPSDPIAFVQSLWVPCVVVGTPLAAGVYRMTIGASRDVLGEDFVRTARAKGLSTRRMLVRHVFPVAAIPVLVLAAAQVNLLITNIGLMQIAFNIPGSFREMKNALDNGDTDLLQALVVYGCIIIAVANMIADLLQARLDPRVREEWFGAGAGRPRTLRRRRGAEDPGVALGVRE